MYIIHKFLAYMIGAMIYSLPAPITKFFTGGGKGFVRGCTAPNKSGDFSQFYDFKAKLIRIEDHNLPAVKSFAELASMWGFMYFILAGDHNNSDEDNAKQIATIDDLLANNKKPIFYALGNEVNEVASYSNDRVENTRKLLFSKYGKKLVVTRGAHTGVNESGAIKAYFEYFNGTRTLLKDSPHLIHFYLKPGKGILVSINNFWRKSMLTYILFRLNLKGISAKQVIIDEAHNADNKVELIVHGSELQPYSNKEQKDGDYVLEDLPNKKYRVIRYARDFIFATKEGWKELEKAVDKLGVPVIMYYAAPFLYYKGNTMLGEKNEP